MVLRIDRLGASRAADPRCPAPFRLRLIGIGFDRLDILLDTGNVTYFLCVGEPEDDLVNWVRFARSLAAGAAPSMRLANLGEAVFTVSDCREMAGWCRLAVEGCHPLANYIDDGQHDGEECEAGGKSGSVAIALRRADLLAQVRGLLAAVADHPGLAAGYLAAGIDIPDNDWERIDREDREAWAKAVAEGSRANDPWDEDHFMVEARAAPGVQPERADFVGAYRAMLRTLEIPPEWERPV